MCYIVVYINIEHCTKLMLLNTIRALKIRLELKRQNS